jgi:hypothetical protein
LHDDDDDDEIDGLLFVLYIVEQLIAWMSKNADDGFGGHEILRHTTIDIDTIVRSLMIVLIDSRLSVRFLFGIVTVYVER